MHKDFRLQKYIPSFFYQAAFDIHPQLVEGADYEPKFKDDGLMYDHGWKPVLQDLICKEDSKLEQSWFKLSKLVNQQHEDDADFNKIRFGSMLYRSLYRCYRGPSTMEKKPHNIRKKEAQKIIKHIDETLLSIKDSHLDPPALCFFEGRENIWPYLLLKHEISEFDHLPGYEPKLSYFLLKCRQFLESYSEKLGTHKQIKSEDDRICDAIRVLFSCMKSNFNRPCSSIVRTFTGIIMRSVLNRKTPVEISDSDFNDAIKIFRNSPCRLSPII